MNYKDVKPKVNVDEKRDRSTRSFAVAESADAPLCASRVQI